MNENNEKVYTTWAVMAVTTDERRKTFADKVPASSEAEARRVFREIYRHSEYRILAAVSLGN